MLRLQGLEISKSELPRNDFFKSPNVWMLYKFPKTKTIKNGEPLLLMEIGIGLDKLAESLSVDEVSYVIMNYEYTSPSDGVKRTRVLFINWAPEKARVRDKIRITMYYPDARRQICGERGTVLDIQANELSDLSTNTLFEKIRIKTTMF